MSTGLEISISAFVILLAILVSAWFTHHLYTKNKIESDDIANRQSKQHSGFVMQLVIELTTLKEEVKKMFRRS